LPRIGLNFDIAVSGAPCEAGGLLR
jgi:hypothetical protein